MSASVSSVTCPARPACTLLISGTSVVAGLTRGDPRIDRSVAVLRRHDEQGRFREPAASSASSIRARRRRSQSRRQAPVIAGGRSERRHRGRRRPRGTHDVTRDFLRDVRFLEIHSEDRRHADVGGVRVVGAAKPAIWFSVAATLSLVVLHGLGDVLLGGVDFVACRNHRRPIPEVPLRIS